MSWTKAEVDYLIAWRRWVDGEQGYPWREEEALRKERETKEDGEENT